MNVKYALITNHKNYRLVGRPIIIGDTEKDTTVCLIGGERSYIGINDVRIISKDLYELLINKQIIDYDFIKTEKSYRKFIDDNIHLLSDENLKNVFSMITAKIKCKVYGIFK